MQKKITLLHPQHRASYKYHKEVIENQKWMSDEYIASFIFFIMANFRNKLRENFSQIPNNLILDNDMSDRARFLFCYMASKPDDWDFLLQPMAKELRYSVDTLRKYINELVCNGWLTKGEQSNEGGKWGAVAYCLESEKQTHGKNTTTIKPDTEKTRHGKTDRQSNKDYISNIDINNNTYSTNIGENKFLLADGFNDDIKPNDQFASNTPPVAHTPPADPKCEVNPHYVKFNEWLKEEAPRVLKMKEPITERQYLKLIEDYKDYGEEIKETLVSMHNHEQLLKKYVSANATLRSWVKRRLTNKQHNYGTTTNTGKFDTRTTSQGGFITKI